MGGGSGGYERPPGDSGSDGDEDGDEPGVVPEPQPDPDETPSKEPEDPDDQPEEPPDSPPIGGGGNGGGSGTPVVGPGGDRPRENGDSDEDKDSESAPGEESQEEDDGKEVSEEPEETDEDQIDRQEGSQDELDGDEDDKPEDDDQDNEDDRDDEDECLITESAFLHSPNPEPLGETSEGEIHSIRLMDQSVCVVDSEARIIGAIAEPWVDTLKECVEQGYQYRAQIIEIDGGSCEVEVTNKCLLDQNIVLDNIDSDVQSQLHPGMTLGIEKLDQEVLVTTDDGRQVDTVPDPWAELLSDCIDQGREYHAEVSDIETDRCRARIRNGSTNE